MKIWKLSAVSGLTFAKTDVHFNHNHDMPEVAQLEKWNALAQKFFRMHQEDLRASFHRRWAVTRHGKYNGRFEKEIKKLEQNFMRKCAGTYQTPRRYDQGPVETYIDEVYDADTDSTGVTRKRRSGGQLRVANNPGHRMKHIVHNVQKWTEQYLTGCSNQGKVLKRWQKFTKKWEAEIDKSPAFQEEFKKEEKYLRSNDGPGRPCGRIYREFGLNGQYMELRDASYDTNNRIDDMGRTDFGNDQLMSMIPFPG